MSGSESFHFEGVCGPGMIVNGFVAVEVDEVPFNRDDSVLSLDVSSSGHSLSMKDRPSSIPSDVVIELLVICDLQLDLILVDCPLALLAFTPMETHNKIIPSEPVYHFQRYSLIIYFPGFFGLFFLESSLSMISGGS